MDYGDVVVGATERLREANHMIFSFQNLMVVFSQEDSAHRTHMYRNADATTLPRATHPRPKSLFMKCCSHSTVMATLIPLTQSSTDSRTLQMKPRITSADLNPVS